MCDCVPLRWLKAEAAGFNAWWQAQSPDRRARLVGERAEVILKVGTYGGEKACAQDGAFTCQMWA